VLLSADASCSPSWRLSTVCIQIAPTGYAGTGVNSCCRSVLCSLQQLLGAPAAAAVAASQSLSHWRLFPAFWECSEGGCLWAVMHVSSVSHALLCAPDPAVGAATSRGGSQLQGCHDSRRSMTVALCAYFSTGVHCVPVCMICSPRARHCPAGCMVAAAGAVTCLHCNAYEGGVHVSAGNCLALVGVQQ